MLSAHLPFFPEGTTHITPNLAFKKENGSITYFNFSMPVFTHEETDLKTFRMITSQFCENGHATQAQIHRAFGVTKISIKRAVKLYRTRGVQGFYEPRKTRGVAVLTPDVLQEIQCQLDLGESISDIAKKQGLKSNTLSKAIRAGHLHQPLKKKSPRIPSSYQAAKVIEVH
jgi:transposase-like protein